MVGAIGGIFEVAGALGKYGVSQSLAKKQREDAEKYRAEAATTKAPALRKEFRDVERMKALSVLTGMPAYEAQQNEIEQQSATALRGGKEAVSSGGDYLDYATKVYAQEQRAKRAMQTQDSTYRAGAIGDYANTVWNTGNEQKANEAIQREERRALEAQASRLEDAATANEYQGKSDAIGEVSAGLASAAGGAAGGMMGGGGGSKGVGNRFSMGAQPIASQSAGSTAMKTTDATSMYATNALKNQPSLSPADLSVIDGMVKKGMSWDEAFEFFMANRKMH